MMRVEHICLHQWPRVYPEIHFHGFSPLKHAETKYLISETSLSEVSAKQAQPNYRITSGINLYED